MKNLNIINKTIMPAMLASLLMLSLSVKAWVVTDPGSYMYYIEQLKTMAEQVESAKGTLDETRELGSAFDGYMADLRSKFDFVTGIKSSLDSQLAGFENYTRSLTADEKKIFDFSREFDMNDLKDVIDINLDGIYIDPTNPDYSASELLKLRNIERQRLLKEGLITTETKLALLEQELKDTQELGDKARQTSNTKEALDLNNALLVKILTALHSLIEVTSTLGQAEMAAGFVNYSKEEHENEANAEKIKYKDGFRLCPSCEAWASKQEWRDFKQACLDFSRENGHTYTTINGHDCSDRAIEKRKAERNKKYKHHKDSRI